MIRQQGQRDQHRAGIQRTHTHTHTERERRRKRENATHTELVREPTEDQRCDDLAHVVNYTHTHTHTYKSVRERGRERKRKRAREREQERGRVPTCHHRADKCRANFPRHLRRQISLGDNITVYMSGQTSHPLY